MIQLYLRTTKISLFAFTIFFALAMLSEFLLAPLYGWSSFFANFFTGISCSFIVVVITSLLQFKSEQKQLNSEITMSIRKLQLSFTYLQADSVGGLLSHENYRIQRIKEFEEDAKRCTSLCMEQCYLCLKSKKLNETVLRSVLIIQCLYVGERKSNYKDFLTSVEPELEKAVASQLELSDKGYYKDEMEKWLKDRQSVSTEVIP